MANENIRLDIYVHEAIGLSIAFAVRDHFKYITPELFFSAVSSQEPFIKTMREFNAQDSGFGDELLDYYNRYSVKIPQKKWDDNEKPEFSAQMNAMLDKAVIYSTDQGFDDIAVSNCFDAILSMDHSFAADLLRETIPGRVDEFLVALDRRYDEAFQMGAAAAGLAPADDKAREEETIRSMAVCLNQNIGSFNPLIGRKSEMDEILLTLCRADKNNPLLLGEAGVGKTAVVRGLAAKIEANDVPEKLKGKKIYSVSLGALMAGTSYRGAFEEKLTAFLDIMEKRGDGIVFFDDIHNLSGAGRMGGDAIDALNIITPYLESPSIRFMGTTTFEDYNRYLAKTKAFTRRFRNIEIAEPSESEACTIISSLLPRYAEFHRVRYAEEAVEFSVKSTMRHMVDRSLPDKAIDLLDEAGAFRALHPGKGRNARLVDNAVLADVLAKMCRVDSISDNEEHNAAAKGLEERILQKIYGQDRAVRLVSEAVQMSLAGLEEPDKPEASLLFIGPTGVGKTEVAKVLAAELGVPLVRFDMSEFAEKHSVAKLIGSPAGYIGYEEGGRLTDAVRKSPDCVLLMDEIDKAHPDIFDIFLQIMDYASLTDNKGVKTDFRHVILIMTSNAGASLARMGTVGYGPGVQPGDRMMQEARKLFKPEFLNRLSATVVFNDMDLEMAGLILDKKLKTLEERLAARGVKLDLTVQAREWLLAKGYSKNYGAREMDRAIGAHLKPMLSREILFGELRGGGKVTIAVVDDNLAIAK